MTFKKIQQIPDAESVKKEIPVSAQALKVKEKRDNDIKEILKGQNDKFIVIIGPCSAHNKDSVYEYNSRLAKVQEQVKDKIIIIPRIYTNKPRTTGAGYKGMIHQPDPNEAPNMVEGIKSIRRMHLKTLEDFGLSAADEMLYPTNHGYLSDILCYVAVGARSVENQHHRLTASGIGMPVGMKNPTSGDVSVMLNSIQAAQMKHNFIDNGWEVETDGNEYAHAILRGAVNKHGENIANYHYEDMMVLLDMYMERKLANPAIIVDTNHSNSGKRFYEQPRIAMEIMRNIERSKDLAKITKGLMIESYIVEGSQKVNGTVFGQSITDACLGWEESEKLLLDIAQKL